MIPRALALLALGLVPAPAHACAVCLDSAFGDRGFNLAFGVFLAMPFVVVAGLVVVFVRLGVGRTHPDPAVRWEEEHRC